MLTRPMVAPLKDCIQAYQPGLRPHERLHHPEKNSITEIGFEEALPLLARHTGNADYLYSSSRIHIMEALYSIGKKLKFYNFSINNFADDAFMTSYNVLSKL